MHIIRYLSEFGVSTKFGNLFSTCGQYTIYNHVHMKHGLLESYEIFKKKSLLCQVSTTDCSQMFLCVQTC